MGMGPACRTSHLLAFPNGSWATFPTCRTVPYIAGENGNEYCFLKFTSNFRNWLFKNGCQLAFWTCTFLIFSNPTFSKDSTISNGPTQSFLWLNLFCHSWTNNRLVLPNTLNHKQTRIPRWTVIGFLLMICLGILTLSTENIIFTSDPCQRKEPESDWFKKNSLIKKNGHESRMRLYPSECFYPLREDSCEDIADPMNQSISAWVDIFS